ncbi:MAG: peptidylprolyl isomerase, partial [Melioribacteraceae bacterium]|nr:peptidylprolyl isomerase [Melioribacteraceae bacterium]
VTKLKAYYKVEDNKEALEYFNTIVTDSFYKRTWAIPQAINTGKLLNKIGEKELTYGEFATYLMNAQRKLRTNKPLSVVVKDNYKAFIDSAVLKYYEDNLENENEEFANIVAEYRDGLLLFELMESEIWNAAKKDSLGLQKFYDKNKENYYLHERVEALVASSNKEKVINKVSKMLVDGYEEEKIKSTLNRKGQVDVIFTSGVMGKTHQALPSDFQFNEGVSKIYKHNDSFVVARVSKVMPKNQMSLEDAMGRVVTDFQDLKEKLWIQNLRETYSVEVNEDVLNKVKSQINN